MFHGPLSTFLPGRAVRLRYQGLPGWAFALVGLLFVAGCQEPSYTARWQLASLEAKPSLTPAEASIIEAIRDSVYLVLADSGIYRASFGRLLGQDIETSGQWVAGPINRDSLALGQHLLLLPPGPTSAVTGESVVRFVVEHLSTDSLVLRQNGLRWVFLRAPR